MYLDVKEINEGDNFAFKVYSAFKGLKIFLPLVTEDNLLRMKYHDPSIVDYILAEWILALATGCRIIPVLLNNSRGRQDLGDLWKDLPDIYPQKTINFVKEQFATLKIPEDVLQKIISGTSEWTVKYAVERVFRNPYINWENRENIQQCRSHILSVLTEKRYNEGDSLKSRIKISDAALQNFYEAQEKRYKDSELEAAMREGKVKANRARVTLVGQGGAGKTCVARSFLNMEFKKDTPSTLGIDDFGEDELDVTTPERYLVPFSNL